jgi:hypothetical protein
MANKGKEMQQVHFGIAASEKEPPEIPSGTGNNEFPKHPQKPPYFSILLIPIFDQWWDIHWQNQ